MGKLPAIQLYPGDWLRDDVAGCSLAAQGLWLRMMFLMHDSERYGYLSKNGTAIPLESIARRCGCTPEQYATLLDELQAAGVPSVTNEGVIFSRRMVKDARERELSKARVANHRKRKTPEIDKCNASCNGDVTHSVTPMYEDEDETENETKVLEELKTKPEISTTFSLDSFDSEERFRRLCDLHPRPEKGHAAQFAYMQAIEREVRGPTPDRSKIADAIDSAAGLYRAMFYRKELGVTYGLANWLEKGIWLQDPKCWEATQKQTAKGATDGW